MFILIDNYDSFTYNLYHMLVEEDVVVFRNDDKQADEVIAMNPEGIFLSPGPCTPQEAGICNALVRKAKESHIPVFGVCLGMQAIAQALGGVIRHARKIMHGKLSSISHEGDDSFQGIPQGFRATRYHSLSVEEASLPDFFTVTARADEDNEIMGLRHKALPLWGVQFHPESIASEHGSRLIKNFIGLARNNKKNQKENP